MLPGKQSSSVAPAPGFGASNGNGPFIDLIIRCSSTELDVINLHKRPARIFKQSKLND